MDVRAGGRERYDQQADAIRARLHERLKQLYKSTLLGELKDREERIAAIQEELDRMEEEAEAQLDGVRSGCSERLSEMSLQVARASKQKDKVEAECGKLRTQLGKATAAPAHHVRLQCRSTVL